MFMHLGKAQRFETIPVLVEKAAGKKRRAPYSLLCGPPFFDYRAVELCQQYASRFYFFMFFLVHVVLFQGITFAGVYVCCACRIRHVGISFLRCRCIIAVS